MSLSSYLEPPDPIFCATHGEDCDYDGDECPEFEGDPCNLCNSSKCRCDDLYEEWRESRWED